MEAVLRISASQGTRAGSWAGASVSRGSTVCCANPQSVIRPARKAQQPRHAEALPFTTIAGHNLSPGLFVHPLHGRRASTDIRGARKPTARIHSEEVVVMRTKFAVLKLGMTIAALVAIAVEAGAGHKFG
jgi:hypothetical protein